MSCDIFDTVLLLCSAYALSDVLAAVCYISSQQADAFQPLLSVDFDECSCHVLAVELIDISILLSFLSGICIG